MNLCGEEQPAASQTSWRATPDIRALEAAILLVEWDRTAIGGGWPADSWDGLDHPLALPLLGGQDIWTTVNFSATGQLCGYEHLMPVSGKANCAFPGPHSERRRTEPQVPRRKMRYQGSSPMIFHTKECGKHVWPPHKPLKWTGLALQWTALAGTPALYQLSS